MNAPQAHNTIRNLLARPLVSQVGEVEKLSPNSMYLQEHAINLVSVFSPAVLKAVAFELSVQAAADTLSSLIESFVSRIM